MARGLRSVWRSLWVLPALWMLCWLPSQAWAQAAVEVSQFRVERAEDGVVLSAQLQFELPSAVEDALVKGIPMVFVSSAEVLRERWYWYDKRMATAERHFRLAFQPLTRKWRLQTGSGPLTASGSGLALSQVHDSLGQALSAVKRISRWKIAEVADLEAGARYRAEFRFQLDVGQLPRPFQIGAIGQSDWDLAASVSAPVTAEASK